MPAPDGTSINLFYFDYADSPTFETSGTNLTSNGASNQAYFGTERFVHYDYLFGHPAGFQLIEPFGQFSGSGNISGTPVNNTFGASNVDISAFFWPYANFQQKQYLVLAGFFYPPVGSYNKNQLVNWASLNSGSNGWAGTFQIGWDQGIGDHFSYDLGVDGTFAGDTTGSFAPGSGLPIGVTTKHDPYARVQLWLNWNWNVALTTSIGYYGTFGGQTSFTNPAATALLGLQPGATTVTGKHNEQQLRAAVGQFLSPNFQVLLDVHGDVAASGGFKEVIGTTLRFLYIF
ncbi:MAG TPA: transporter [Acidisphaera sp.]|nr:transporter [Acidisphaera sp.]